MIHHRLAGINDKSFRLEAPPIGVSQKQKDRKKEYTDACVNLVVLLEPIYKKRKHLCEIKIERYTDVLM
jgi:hypothetical protein